SERTRFEKIIENKLAEATIEEPLTSNSVPYQRVENDKSSIVFDEFYKLTRQRRSVRWFLKQPVPRDLIDKAIMAAGQSPSACNRQPYEFRVFDDSKLVGELVKLPMG